MGRLRETRVELEVPFHHVDALGVVWHGHYLEYLEPARTALLRGCWLGTEANVTRPPRISLRIFEACPDRRLVTSLSLV